MKILLAAFCLFSAHPFLCADELLDEIDCYDEAFRQAFELDLAGLHMGSGWAWTNRYACFHLASSASTDLNHSPVFWGGRSFSGYSRLFVNHHEYNDRIPCD